MSFTTELPVRIGDINYGQHLGHDRLITLLHEARLAYFAHLGVISETGLIMKALQIDYLGEAFWGDVLTVRLTIKDLKKVQFSMDYEVYCGHKPIATATTKMVSFDYQNRKVQALPEAFIRAVSDEA